MTVRMRHTRATTGDRRSHHALKPQRLSRCANCGAQALRHRACVTCGVYRGKQVIDVVAKQAKKTAKKKEKAASR
ncbi:MAG TPA: 50S ribosomal protein L32 [Candidatus Paceibacterota bacterium]|nr:50S ribosomal protein L32 [Candidatus Paceibacterota bacterium]